MGLTGSYCVLGVGKRPGSIVVLSRNTTTADLVKISNMTCIPDSYGMVVSILGLAALVGWPGSISSEDSARRWNWIGEL